MIEFIVTWGGWILAGLITVALAYYTFGTHPDKKSVEPQPRPAQPEVWVPYEGNNPPMFEMELLDGKWWYEHPYPVAQHECSAVTRGWNVMTYIERCACGSIRMNRERGEWLERNSR